MPANSKDKITSNPLFKQIKIKSCLISSEPCNKLCRIIRVKIFVPPDNAVIEVSINHHANCIKTAIGVEVKIVKNIPKAITIIVVGNSHQIIYCKKAKTSIGIPVLVENSINGINDSKLKTTIGIITATSIAKKRIVISFAVPTCLQSINSFIRFRLSFNQKITTKNTGYKPKSLVI